MKKLFLFLGLATAVLTQTGCGKEFPETFRPSGNAGFELFASHSDEFGTSGSASGLTRTVNDGLATKWAEDDAIGVRHSLNGGSADIVSDGKFSLADADDGMFTGSVSGTLEEGSEYDWYALYPYSESGGVTIGGSSQTQTGNDSRSHLAGAVCPLYGIAENVPTGTNPSFTMKNLSAVVRIVVENRSGSDLTVGSVSFTASENIVGQYDVDFVSSSSVKYTPCSESEVSETVQLTVSGGTAVQSGSSASFYLVMKPFTASAGSTVQIAVNGFEKSVTLGEDMDFAAGSIKKLHFTYNAGADILPGLDIVALRNASKWYINEYRAGFGLDAGDYGNNTTFLMAAQFADWYGRWEYQNEGCTLRIIDGSEDDSSKTADLTKFNSYTYGLKKITEDNKILSVYSRIHHSSRHSDDSAPWGVMVVDLSRPSPEAVPVNVLGSGDTIVYGTSTDYTDTAFDLSDYVGKEVIVAIGLYRQYDGYCDYQLPLAHISFGPEKVSGHTALGTYGTAVAGLEDWRLSLEEVRSIMPNTRTGFNGSKGTLVWSASPWFSVWAGTGHIASEWGLQVVRQNYCTASCGEGFMLDTRDLSADFSTPVSYFYSKFNIDSYHDKMSFYTRNFSSSVYTYFKVTVIDGDGNVNHLSPSANTATAAEAADSGCWKFIHESGWSDDLDSCARFDYDLSAFSGKDVVICIGLYSNGSDEQKLVFCLVEFE